jgi:hypothetical protein
MDESTIDVTFPENAVWLSRQRGDRGPNSGTEAAQINLYLLVIT